MKLSAKLSHIRVYFSRMLPSYGVQSLVGGEERAQHFSKASLWTLASTPSGEPWPHLCAEQERRAVILLSLNVGLMDRKVRIR